MKNKSWRHTEDLLLVEIVLDFTSRGVNLSEAFRAASEKLPGRTAKACYSRWKNRLEYLYTDAIHEAIKEQKVYSRNVVSSILSNQIEAHIDEDNVMSIDDDASISFSCKEGTSDNTHTFDDILKYLSNMNSLWVQVKKENDQLINELDKVWNESEKLKMKLIDYESNYEKWDILNRLAEKLESVSV